MYFDDVECWIFFFLNIHSFKRYWTLFGQALLLFVTQPELLKGFLEAFSKAGFEGP